MTETEHLAAEPPAGVVVDNVGGAILRVIRSYGVDTVFGIPGTHNLEFYRHLGPLGFRAVTTRHEQGAGYAADGWSQQTRLPGVVITTSGPGLLNVLSSAATAYAESRPMIVLSPGAPRGSENADVGELHETKRPTGATGALLEWARRVTTAGEAVEAVHDAFALFRTGRPRPVHIEVPLDLLEGPADVPADDLAARPMPTPAPADDDLVARAALALAAASAPLVIAGGGSVDAADALRALVERLDAPLLTTLNAKGVVDERHPLALGASLRFEAARAAASAADVLLVVGSKLGEAERWWEPLTPTGTVIRIDLLASQLDKHVTPTIGLLGDARAVLPKLLAALEAAGPTSADHGAAARVAALRPEFAAEARAVAPDATAVAEVVAQGLPHDIVLSGDSSQVAYLGTASTVAVSSAGSYLYMATYATLGYGLPAAIGAKIAAPDRPVACVLGDGALMLSVQELMTAVEQRLDLVVVCVDNGGYGEIRQNELDRGIEPVGVDLVQPSWPALATAFGATGHELHHAHDLPEAIASALAAGGVHLLHVPTRLFAAA